MVPRAEKKMLGGGEEAMCAGHSEELGLMIGVSFWELSRVD